MVMLCVLSATENHNLCFVSIQFETLGGSVQRKFYKDQVQGDPGLLHTLTSGPNVNALEKGFLGLKLSYD